MSQYLPPIRINELFNVADFNDQYDFINYFNGDNRYVKKKRMKTGYTGFTVATGYTGYTGSHFQLQAKTQFQSFTLDLSENRNSTLFNSNVKVTDGVTGDNNEIVNLFVTRPSSFKLGIRNDGTFNQIGTSTFNDHVNLVEYVQNPNTSTQKVF